jgi:hypothetical protein
VDQVNRSDNIVSDIAMVSSPGDALVAATAPGSCSNEPREIRCIVS